VAAPKADTWSHLYGEKTPGAEPINLQPEDPADHSPVSGLAGRDRHESFVRYRPVPDKLTLAIAVPKGATEADIHPLAPGTTFCFRIEASRRQAESETPIYLADTLGCANSPERPSMPAVRMAFSCRLRPWTASRSRPSLSAEIAERAAGGCRLHDLNGWGAFNTEIGVYHVTQPVKITKVQALYVDGQVTRARTPPALYTK